MHNLSDLRLQIHSISKVLCVGSSQVTLNLDKIEGLINLLEKRHNVINTNTDSGDIGISNQIGLILCYGPMHYCFTNPRSQKEYTYKDNGSTFHRSAGFITALKHAAVEWDKFDIVRDITLSDWHKIVQTRSETDLYDLDNRYYRMKKFVDYLISRGISNVSEYITQITSAEESMNILIGSGLFFDVFYKRAQVTTYLINATLKKYQKPIYKDIGLLTAMPDYRLPQLLYNLGILNISDELKEQLNNKTLIIKYSPEELALRASVIVVAEVVATQLGLSESEVDSLMWGLSQELVNDGKMVIPAMLVETRCY